MALSTTGKQPQVTLPLALGGEEQGKINANIPITGSTDYSCGECNPPFHLDNGEEERGTKTGGRKRERQKEKQGERERETEMNVIVLTTNYSLTPLLREA